MAFPHHYQSSVSGSSQIRSENCKMFRLVMREYDIFLLHNLSSALKQTRKICYSQINGTTGYEEAACWIIAGMNAHLSVNEQIHLH